MKQLIKLQPQWAPSSWRDFPIKQRPLWPKEKLNKALIKLSAFPALVPIQEIISLKNQFKNVARKKAFILIAGDCAETFSDFNNDSILFFSLLVTLTSCSL